LAVWKKRLDRVEWSLGLEVCCAIDCAAEKACRLDCNRAEDGDAAVNRKELREKIILNSIRTNAVEAGNGARMGMEWKAGSDEETDQGANG
jgi:hypothetical protein